MADRLLGLGRSHRFDRSTRNSNDCGRSLAPKSNTQVVDPRGGASRGELAAEMVRAETFGR